MDERISVLKENQELLGNKISMLQETNKKKDEEADKIRELIAECRQNLDRIKSEAKSAIPRPECSRQPDSSSRRCKSPPDEERMQPTGGRQESGCGKSRSAGQSSDDPCSKFRQQSPSSPCNRPTSKSDDPTGTPQSSCEALKDPCGDSTKVPCESRTFTLKTQISAIADAQDKSRQCIERLGERMEREVKMRIVQSNANGCSQYDPCQCETDSFQERVSCRVDLSKMKVNIRGPPEDLKKLDAVQLINLLDKFQCQELVINTGDNESQLGFQGEVPIFYITHPGNLVLIVGIAMVAFLVNANLCGAKHGNRTKLLLNMLYLGSFAFHYGIVLWMSFIRGLTLSMGLPREVFNTVDNLILPKYFSICVFLGAITLYSFLATHCPAPCTSWPLPVITQIIIESTTFLIELVTVCYIVPAISKLRELTDEYTSEDDDCPPPESYCRNMERLAKLNWTITVINTITVMFMGSNLYYASSKLNIG